MSKNILLNRSYLNLSGLSLIIRIKFLSGWIATDTSCRANSRDFKQIATAADSTAVMVGEVWGEVVP